ncbi:MAG: hypothetical protein Q4A81_01775 [Pasteurellaceae bacterium]|nr:hypothetical protein [Pasteurellaceae bacterium]
MAGLNDDHHFIVSETDDGKTLFIQLDTYTGATATINAEMLAKNQIAEFEKFNKELKMESEKRFPQ